MSIKAGTHLMELFGQLIWELVEYFGEMISMVTVPILGVLLAMGVGVEFLFGKRIRDRRSTRWKPTDAIYG